MGLFPKDDRAEFTARKVKVKPQVSVTVRNENSNTLFGCFPLIIDFAFTELSHYRTNESQELSGFSSSSHVNDSRGTGVSAFFNLANLVFQMKNSQGPFSPSCLAKLLTEGPGRPFLWNSYL